MEMFIPAFFNQASIHEQNRLAFGHTYSVHLMNAPVNQKHARLIQDTTKNYFTYIRFYTCINSEKNVVGYADKELTKPIGIFPVSHCLKIEDLTPDLAISESALNELLKSAPTAEVTFDFSNANTAISPAIAIKEEINVEPQPSKNDSVEEDEYGQMTLF